MDYKCHITTESWNTSPAVRNNEVTVISPALTVRNKFHKGKFELRAAPIGFRIVRVETYEHEVNWLYGSGWKCTGLESKLVDLFGFLSSRTAHLAMDILEERYSPTDVMFQEIVGDIGLMYRTHTSFIRKLKREIKKEISIRRRSTTR